jgi:hypothetical protein
MNMEVLKLWLSGKEPRYTEKNMFHLSHCTSQIDCPSTEHQMVVNFLMEHLYESGLFVLPSLEICRFHIIISNTYNLMSTNCDTTPLKKTFHYYNLKFYFFDCLITYYEVSIVRISVKTNNGPKSLRENSW